VIKKRIRIILRRFFNNAMWQVVDFSMMNEKKTCLLNIKINVLIIFSLMTRD